MSALFTQRPGDTVKTGTGKVDLVQKCTTAARVLLEPLAHAKTKSLHPWCGEMSIFCIYLVFYEGQNAFAEISFFFICLNANFIIPIVKLEFKQKSKITKKCFYGVYKFIQFKLHKKCGFLWKPAKCKMLLICFGTNKKLFVYKTMKLWVKPRVKTLSRKSNKFQISWVCQILYWIEESK